MVFRDRGSIRARLRDGRDIGVIREFKTTVMKMLKALVDEGDALQ